MGCDIHLYTEVKTTVDGKKKWNNCDDWRLNKYFGSDENESQYNIHSIYRHRDYELFTILAGVRQYNDKNIPISKPRGLPHDVSDVVKAESDRWDSDGHSHSYLSYAELEEYAKETGQVTYSGLITPEAKKALEKDGDLPKEWCQGSTDKTLVWAEWKAPFTGLQDLLKAMEARMRDELWIWGNDPIPAEKKLDFRIVFWFDN